MTHADECNASVVNYKVIKIGSLSMLPIQSNGAKLFLGSTK